MIRKIILAGIISTVVIAFMLTYWLFDPTSSELFPKCQFLMLTGYQCPGCGSQRAIHALLHGNLVSAFKFNAGFIIGLLVITIYLFAEVFKRHFKRFYRTLNSQAAIYSILAMIIAWWVLRNLFA